MKLDDLKKLGVFVPSDTKEIEVKWTDFSGEEPQEVSATLSIKQPSAADTNRVVRQAIEEDAAQSIDQNLLMICACVVDDDGQPMLTYSQAKQLGTVFVNSLYMAIIEANGKPRDPKPKSRQKKNSGVKSQ